MPVPCSDSYLFSTQNYPKDKPSDKRPWGQNFQKILSYLRNKAERSQSKQTNKRKVMMGKHFRIGWAGNEGL
jgi:hypothetical protein